MQVRAREETATTPAPAVRERNRSIDKSWDLHSIDDNQSLRHSIYDNIEKEAREYEKQQELVERKQHYKRLLGLQQMIKDVKAKNSIHQLLVKGGVSRPKIKEKTEDAEVDLLKMEIDREKRAM